jgi:hypothetical protein
VDTVGEGNTRAGLSHRHKHMHTRISWRRRRLFSVHMISAPRAVQSKRKHQSNSSKTIINNANVSVKRINASRGCWQHLHSRSQPTQTHTAFPMGTKKKQPAPVSMPGHISTQFLSPLALRSTVLRRMLQRSASSNISAHVSLEAEQTVGLYKDHGAHACVNKHTNHRPAHIHKETLKSTHRSQRHRSLRL